jgi:hypothetical protein
MPATWSEVQANPEFQKLSAEQKEIHRKQYFDDVVAPKVPKEQLTQYKQQFDKDTLKAAPAEQKSLMGKVGDMLGDKNPAVGVLETGAHMATGAAALPFEAAASLTAAATAPAGLRAKMAAGASQAVGDALTYEPRSTAGKQLTKAASDVLGIPGMIGDKAQEAVGGALENKGIPGISKAAQVTARMVPEAATVLAGGALGDTLEARAGAAASKVTAAAAKLASTTDAARTFVTKAGLKWDDLSYDMKRKISSVARDPEELKKLDPETLKREVRAEGLGLPITRGQATRNVEQLTREENISKSGSDNPVRDIHAKQDEVLHGKVDEVRKSTGAKAETDEAIGTSVQDTALREKAKVSKEHYDEKYRVARETEPDAAVPPAPLYELLKNNPEIQHLQFMESWLKKAKVEVEEGKAAEPKSWTNTRRRRFGQEPGKPVKEDVPTLRNLNLRELDDLRKKAAGIARGGVGDNKYYAGEVVKAIDRAFDKVPPAAKAWREARDAFKAHKKEFEGQGIVRDLVSEKKNSSDRRTAVEETVNKVMGRSKEDIGRLKKTLLEGGNAKTRAAGEAAWRNVQAGVLDYLKGEAAGKRGIVGEKSQAEFNAKFRDAFSRLDKNGKIDVIFDKAQAKKLRDIYEAVGDVRTKPSARISGSPTAANMQVENTLSKLEKVSMVPYVGKPIAGLAKVAGSVYRAGEKTRAAAHAKGSPTSEAAERVRVKRKGDDAKKTRSQNTLKRLRRVGPPGSLTLQNQNDQPQQQ